MKRKEAMPKNSWSIRSFNNLGFLLLIINYLINGLNPYNLLLNML